MMRNPAMQAIETKQRENQTGVTAETIMTRQIHRSVLHSVLRRGVLTGLGVLVAGTFFPLDNVFAQSGPRVGTTLEMFANGLTDRQGRPVVIKGAAQQVGPIALRASGDGPHSEAARVKVSLQLSEQLYQAADGVDGTLRGVEFGQVGPQAADKIARYAPIAEDAGPAAAYTVSDALGSGQGVAILGKDEDGEMNYAVQMAVFGRALAGQPAGVHPMADLRIRFDRPVSNPVLHFHGLGESAGMSAEFRLVSTDAAGGARFKRLSGTGGRFDVSVDRVGNLRPGSDCRAPEKAPGGACGSVQVEGVALREVHLKVLLHTTADMPAKVTSDAAGVDRLGISVSVADPGIALAGEGAPALAAGWTGFYAGLTAGAIINDVSLRSKQIGLLDGQCDRSGSFDSFLPGVHAGYLRRVSDDWVAGVEADFTYPDSTRHLNCLCYDSAIDKFQVKNRIQGSLRARLAYPVDRFLPYVTAGVSFADMGLTYANEFGDGYGKSTTQTGWVLGGGVEYRLLERVSVRAEYLYADYGRALQMGLPFVQGVDDPTGRAVADAASHTFRLGINYRFSDD